MKSNGSASIPKDAIDLAKVWCADYVSPKRFGLLNVISGDPIPWESAIDIVTWDMETLEHERSKKAERRPRTFGQIRLGGPAPAQPHSRDAFIRRNLLPGTMRRLAIIGEGGSGKSEYMRRIAFLLARHFSGKQIPPDALVPVHVELWTVDLPSGVNSDTLRQALVRPSAWDWLKPLADAGRVAFILDGLDEVRLENRDSFTRSLEDLIADFPQCTFFVAGRSGSISQRSLPEFTGSAQHRIAPLTEDQIRRYVSAYFVARRSPALSSAFWAELQSRRVALLDLMRTPFMLSFALEHFEAHHASEGENLPASPASLVVTQLRRLFDRRRQRTRLPGDDVCLATLSTLAAFSIVRPPRERHLAGVMFSYQEAKSWLVGEAAHIDCLRGVADLDRAAGDLLNLLVPACGVLAAQGANVSFTNRVIQEFLGARWIALHGYPRWPYHDGGDRYVDPQQVPDPRERQLLEWFGDFVWSNETRELLQAVCFDLGRQTATVAESGLCRRNVELLIRCARWVYLTARPFGCRDSASIDAKGTLVTRFSEVVRSLPASLTDEQSAAVADMAFDILPPDSDWSGDWYWCEWVSMLPRLCRDRYLRPQTDALRAADAKNKDSWRAICQATDAIALCLSDDAAAMEEALAALTVALAAAVGDPYKYESEIFVLAGAITKGFSRSPVFKRRALAALAESLTSIDCRPRNNWYTIDSLAHAIAQGFSADPTLADTALAALTRALSVATRSPETSCYAIASLSSPIIYGFPTRPLAICQAWSALTARIAAASKGSDAAAWDGIHKVAWAIKEGFWSDDARNDEALTLLSAALENLMDKDSFAIHKISMCIAEGFSADPVLKGKALRTLLASLAAAAKPPVDIPVVSNLAEKIPLHFSRDVAAMKRTLAAATIALDALVSSDRNRDWWLETRSLPNSIALIGVTVPKMKKKALAVLIDALAIVSQNPGENWHLICTIASGITQSFKNNEEAMKEALAALSAALAVASADATGNWRAICEVASAISSSFPANESIMTTALGAMTNALDVAIREIERDPKRVFGLCKSIASDFASSGTLKGEAFAAVAKGLAELQARDIDYHDVSSLVGVIASNFALDVEMRDKVLAALTSALGSARYIERARDIAWVLGSDFAGSLDAAVAVVKTGVNDELNTVEGRGWVKLWGEEAKLREYFIESWRLPEEPPIIKRLNDPTNPEKPKAVIVAPREKIRRGLPAELLAATETIYGVMSSGSNRAVERESVVTSQEAGIAVNWLEARDIVQHLTQAVRKGMDDVFADMFEEAMTKSGATQTRKLKKIIPKIEKLLLTDEERSRFRRSTTRMQINGDLLKLVLDRNPTVAKMIVDTLSDKFDPHAYRLKQFDIGVYCCPECGAIHMPSGSENKPRPPEHCEACTYIFLMDDLPENWPANTLHCKGCKRDYAAKSPATGRWPNEHRQRGLCPAENCRKTGQKLIQLDADS